MKDVDKVVLSNLELGVYQEPLKGFEKRYPVLVRKGLVRSQLAKDFLGRWRQYCLTVEGARLKKDHYLPYLPADNNN